MSVTCWQCGQRVALGDDDLAVPAINPQQHQAWEQARPSRWRSPAAHGRSRPSLRSARMCPGAGAIPRPDTAPGTSERHSATRNAPGYGWWQSPERPAIVLVQISEPPRPQALDLGQCPPGILQDLGALRRDTREGPPLAHEQVKAELPLERFERPADGRLRGAQRRGGLGHGQPVARDGHGVLQLVNSYREASGSGSGSLPAH